MASSEVVERGLNRADPISPIGQNGGLSMTDRTRSEPRQRWFGPHDAKATTLFLLLAVSPLGLAVGRAAATDVARTDRSDLYEQRVQPILAESCYACHGPSQSEGGLRLDLSEVVGQTLDSGSRPIVAGQPHESELLVRVTSEDPDQRMPPDGDPLTAGQIATLREWIATGASWSQHWAFRPIERPPLATLGQSDSVRGPIDTFVAARLESMGLDSAPPAERAVLLKRLCYDLLGLPPTLEQRDAFLNDPHPDAYSRLVDRLMATPQFGERWGRHWLDKARYADSDGYEKDRPRPNAWRYRDWVVQAVNADMPLTDFTQWQLGGDLLDDANESHQLATAFHRQTLTNTEGGTDQEEFRVAAIFDRVETTATVWLGLTMTCARCHDHKYDAFSQRDYYSLFALFNNADESETDVAIDTHSADATMKVRVLAERSDERRETHVLERGDFLRPGDPVAPGILPQLLDSEAATRLDLARWITDASNPLPRRVLANQIWLHLFGRGLVDTPDDFGVRGSLPTHPRLLDWLASELGTHWSRKELIHTILLSATYQQNSTTREAAAKVDPQNRWLHRQNRSRVEAEVVRDIYLALGSLLTERIGGPSVFPWMSPEVASVSYANQFQWKTSQGADRYRRGMYTFFKRTAPHPNLSTFDCPDSNTTKVQRAASNSPLQALVTLNHVTFIEAARGLAKQLVVHSGDDAAKIAWGYTLCTQRDPPIEVIEQFATLLAKARTYYGEQTGQAAAMAGVDDASPQASELAAWTVVARAVLNLEPVLVRE